MTDLKKGEWTTSEIQLLIANRHKGARECALILNRSIKSVKRCAYRHRISLRTKNCRHGLVLGQPRGVSLAKPEARDTVLAELRMLALEGKVDLTEVERRIREDVDLPLCPECSRFPVRHPSWGACDPCHKKRLEEAHKEELARLQAQKDLNKSKAKLKRFRESHGIRAPKARD